MQATAATAERKDLGISTFPIICVSALALVVVLEGTLSGCTQPSGRQAFVTYGCPQCHGIDGEGTSRGPALKNLREFWTSSELMAYLRHPEGYALKNERIRELLKVYKVSMPAYTIDDQVRSALVQYLLEQ
jgi:cytochrome c553